ncbi:hypothetical protein GCM10010505_46770 [Kitasatospora aburaviensis]
MKVSGSRSGRVSVAGLIAVRPGSRTRLSHRIRLHTGRKGERRSLSERDYIGLIDGIHHLVKAPIVLVWDRLNTHVSRAMHELVAARDWLTVYILPAYAPDLNPVEWLWAHVKRSLANLSSVAVDRLEALVRNRLKRLQYRPDILNGFLAGTGLSLDLPPPSAPGAPRSVLSASVLSDGAVYGHSGLSEPVWFTASARHPELWGKRWQPICR